MNLETKILVGMQRATAQPMTLPVARALSFAGEHSGAWLATAAVGAAIDRRRRGEWLRAGGVVLSAHALSVVLKRVVRRIRPEHPDVAVHVSTPSRWSFPSSHATSTTTAAIVFAPLLGRWTALLAPAMVWSRMALGVHYPTDVLSGTVLGATVGYVGERRRKEAA